MNFYVLFLHFQISCKPKSLRQILLGFVRSPTNDNLRKVKDGTKENQISKLFTSTSVGVSSSLR